MNVFIVAVCVNLITLVTAAHNINLDTILKILKVRSPDIGQFMTVFSFEEVFNTQKHRKTGYSNIDETKEAIEAIPIIPGFYLQKPKDLSKSLFENPKTWPDDLIGILSSEDTKTRHNKTRISAKTANKSPRDDYLLGKILKAVKNLNKYQNSQINNNGKITKTKTYMECDDDLISKKDLLKKSKANVAEKEPVKKLLGRIFQGIKGGIVYRGKGKYKQPRNQANGSATKKKIGNLLKNIIYGNMNIKKNRGHEKYQYDETKEKSKKTGDLLGSILNAIQRKDQGQGSKINQRKPLLIISSASLHGNAYEDENNAKESMEVSDEEYDGSDSPDFYHTRRNDKNDRTDIGSEEPSDTSASSSSDYEKNPGNPYTVYKNKYKQNWPYNHYMDGDHMNINPFGPQFGNLGPTGPELFFGRKWWYFNQDDYKPM